MGIQETGEKKVGQVQIQSDKLGREIELLEKELGRLADRLIGISSDFNSGETPVEETIELCQVATVLRNYSDRIKNISIRVNSIINNLEI
jgi:uncharacterized protein Yka (UPF0111/DUF47 family)